jgi:transcriptional regulator with XRE-family HTH domain
MEYLEHLRSLLKKEISEKGLNMSSLDKKAGVSSNTTRNIIMGHVKNPSILSLKAIAKALGYSLEELLKTPEETYPEEQALDAPSKDLLQEPSLLTSTLKATLDIFENNNIDMYLDDVLNFAKEGYLFSAKRNNKKVDRDFIKWLIEKETGKHIQ